MQHHHPIPSSPEVMYAAPHEAGTKSIWKTFWILLIITMMELGLGLLMYSLPNMGAGVKLFIKGSILILSLLKAFYIVSIFMHLGSELRKFAYTIVLPLSFLIWGVVAFIYDGGSFQNNRTKFDRYFSEQAQQSIKSSREWHLNKPVHHSEHKEDLH